MSCSAKKERAVIYTSPNDLPVSGLLADFQLFKAILQQTHAGLYKYRSAREIDSIFTYYEARIRHTNDLIAFYQCLSVITCFVGSLHDEVSLPETVVDSLYRQKTFFPYPIKVINGQLLLNCSGTPIPLGSEILAINQHAAKDMLPGLYKYYTTDGVNLTGKAVGINAYFPWFFRLEYGFCPQFRVVYKPYPRQATKEIVLAAANFPTYQGHYRQRHSIRLDTLLKRKYAFQFIDSLRTGLLTVHTFDLGNRSTRSHQAYRQFLDSCFRLLQKEKASTVVVDIRKNGGGDDPNDLLTFSYLAHHDFKENAQAFTLFQKVPFRPYLFAEDTTETKELEANLVEEHSVLRNGKYYQHPRFNPVWHPNPRAFKGKIFLLISPQVASAASLFASLVKSEGYATLVGEESMGGYYGHTGHNSLTYQLPHTRIVFQVAIVDLNQAVVEQKAIPFGWGVIPDTIVGPTRQDFLTNQDPVLRYVLSGLSNQAIGQ